MSYQTENSLWEIEDAIRRKTGDRILAEKIAAPLVHQISTGRCTGAQSIKLGKANKRQIATIANRLVKINPHGTADYEDVIPFVMAYIDTI